MSAPFPVDRCLKLVAQNLRQLSPAPEWFAAAAGIHGLTHTLRVHCLVTAIGVVEAVTAEELDWLQSAALLHDIGRDHDGVDWQHGEASHQKAVRLGLLSADGPVRDIIVSHSRDDRRMLTGHAVPHLIRIFKDADGLDRVRIGDLDSRYLRTATGRMLTPVAWPFYRATRDLLPGPELAAAVVDAFGACLGRRAGEDGAMPGDEEPGETMDVPPGQHRL